MKYTPGPWEVEECVDGRYQMTSPGETLEETRLIGVIEPACNIKNDAPLIEVAPELLEISKKLLKKFNNYEEVTGTIEEVAETVEELRRIIEKVEGGNS